MTARRVFFAFHNKRDFSRANEVRARYALDGGTAEGFHDISLWRETEHHGKQAVEQMISTAIARTSVTVVLIGSETANRGYMNHEIARTLANGNGLLGVHIHDIKDADGNTAEKGAVPAGLIAAGAPIYDWDRDNFTAWVEAAARKAGT
jgi:hypothetical protein